MKHTLWAISANDVFGQAAGLSYYFLLAIFPALLFLISLWGHFAGENAELRTNLFQYLSEVLPEEASQLVTRTVDDVARQSGGGKISFGILASLWAASNGMGALLKSLNTAYHVKETRPWWKVRLVGVGLTLLLAGLIASALIIVLSGRHVAEWAMMKWRMGNTFMLTWNITQWPIMLVCILLAFAILYYFGPDVPGRQWKWITPGALVGILFWLVVSFGFKTYLLYFNTYSATYGSLGAVIILMLWFYFTGAAILIGGEINATIDPQFASRKFLETKETR